eukprot:Opistho-2@21870
MNYAERVYVFQSQNQFRSVEPRPRLVHARDLIEKRENVATARVLHNNVHIIHSLEAVVQPNHKRRVDRRQCQPLILHVLHLVSSHHLLLRQHFDCVIVARASLTGEIHLPKRTAADGLEQAEVVDGGHYCARASRHQRKNIRVLRAEFPLLQNGICLFRDCKAQFLSRFESVRNRESKRFKIFQEYIAFFCNFVRLIEAQCTLHNGNEFLHCFHLLPVQPLLDEVRFVLHCTHSAFGSGHSRQQQLIRRLNVSLALVNHCTRLRVPFEYIRVHLLLTDATHRLCCRRNLQTRPLFHAHVCLCVCCYSGKRSRRVRFRPK